MKGSLKGFLEVVGACLCLVGMGLLGILILALALGIAFGWLFLLTWLVTLVASGFDCTMPFWPTMGAIFLFQILFVNPIRVAIAAKGNS